MSIFTNTLFTIGQIHFSLVNFLMFIVIFAVAYIVSKVVAKYLNRWLKSNDSHVVEKYINLKEGWRKAIVRLSKQVIFILAFLLAIKSFGINNKVSDVSSILEFKLIRLPNFELALYHIFLVIAVIFAAKILINLIKLYVNKRLSRQENFDEGTEYVIIQLAKYIIYVISFIICIRSFVHDMTIFIGSITGLLVGVGLGLQDLFKDIVAGFILLFENTVKVGDIVEIKYGNVDEIQIAKVLRINLRTIKIETRDGNVLIIPNNKFTQDVIHNWSFNDTLSRFHIPISIKYKGDIELAKKMLEEAAYSHPDVSKVKPIIVRLNHFGNHGLELELVFWARQRWDFELVTSDIRFEIDRKFREHDIDVPFPQITIHQSS